VVENILPILQSGLGISLVAGAAHSTYNDVIHICANLSKWRKLLLHLELSWRNLLF
jgi:hypothetical protein